MLITISSKARSKEIKKLHLENITYFIFSIVFVFVAPILIMCDVLGLIQDEQDHNQRPIPIISYIENDILHLRHYTNDSSSHYIVGYEKISDSLDDIVILNHRIDYTNSAYSYEIPVSTLSSGKYKFHFKDTKSNIVLSSGVIDYQKSKLIVPSFEEIIFEESFLFLKFKNPSFNSCRNVTIKIKDIKNDYTFISNKKPKFLDSLSIPINNNQYSIELELIDSFGIRVASDTLFTGKSSK